MRKKIWMILISVFILMLIVSPISASEDVDGDVCLDAQDIGLSEEAPTDTLNINPSENLEEINDNENTNNIPDNTPNNILETPDTQYTLTSQYTLSDDTYSQYFNAGGSIIGNTLKSGDTLIIQNLTKKKLIITLPLNLIGSNEYAMSNSSIIVERGGANSNITGLKIIAKNGDNPIYLRNTENVTVKDCYLVTINFAIPMVNSNHNTIINNTIDNDLSNGHSAIVLGNSHYNNISNNSVKNGANCIYLCSYSFLDHNGGESNNNIITYNNISGVVTSICYGIVIMGNNNTLMYNNVENTGLGIFTNGKNNTIYFNNVTNGGEGISESGTDKTLNNTIDGELINGNQYNPTIDTTVKETIYVDGKTGNDNNIGTKDKPFKTIKAAVNYVNEKEEGTYEIIVAEGTYKENNIKIENHINLIGKGKVTINGDNKNNILLVNQPKNLYIKSITFTKGKAKENSRGSAIYTNGNLTLKDCSFNNNKATNEVIWGRYITIDNCKFESNTAPAVIYVKDELNLHNSTFTKNTIMGDGALIGTYMTFDKEKERDPGVMIIENSAKINIADTLFVNNNGFAMILIGNGNIRNCSFIKNKGSSIYGFNMDIIQSEFINNTGDEHGQIWVIEGGKTKVKNCIFANNTAQSYGAAITQEHYYGSVEVYNSEFYNNSLKLHQNLNGDDSVGGAIFAFGKYKTIIKNCTFEKNAADSGGAIFTKNGVLDVQDSKFINNTAKNVGGAIRSDECSVSNSKFLNNSATFGGAIATHYGKISKSTFEGNIAANGKDIFIMDYFYSLNLGTGNVEGLKRGKVDITNDNYWGNVSSKDTFIDEKRILKGIYAINYTIDENNNVIWGPAIYRATYLTPDAWIILDDSDNNGGIGDGTGTGIGNGTGNGTGNGDGNGDGSGTGTGNGIGEGTGTGNGNGDGSGTGTGNGNGLGDMISDLINNIRNSITTDGNQSENFKANATNNPKTDIKTDAGTYSTDPSPSKAESSSSESPGTSGGHLKAYELEKKIKIDLTKDNIYLSILLLLIFSSLFLFGFFKEKRDDGKK